MITRTAHWWDTQLAWCQTYERDWDGMEQAYGGFLAVLG